MHLRKGFLWLIKYTFLEKFPSKSCAVAVQGIETSPGLAAFSKSGLTMGTVFLPRRPWLSQGSWACCTMSDTFYGLHFSKHHRRKEGALSAKYSREGLYGFLKGAQNQWCEKMLKFHCALCFAWFAWLKEGGKKMDSVSEPETIDNSRKQPGVCRKKFFPPFYLCLDRVWPGDYRIMPEGKAKRFPPLLFWVTPALWEHTAGWRKTNFNLTGFLECANVLKNCFSRLSS